MNYTIIKVTEQNVKSATEDLHRNFSYLKIDNSLFSVNKITTLLKPVFNYNDDDTIDSESFVFSYADANIKRVYLVAIDFEPTSFFEFLKISKQLNEAQLNEIIAKEFEYLKDSGCVETDEDEDECMKWGYANQNLDKMVFNEALVYILSGRNKEDCEQIKNDVWDKFINWREKKLEINIGNDKAINDIYDMLMDLKTMEK